ncbi:MAG: type II toxin-antitoxin system VapC family toxin [Lentisphaeria bacterium]|nr:type II toxin-antitoxin system VapC family toxin [Lentisphaeria bacterium]
MIGIDTNVLVRQIVQDDEGQAALAQELIEDRCSPKNQAHLPLVVLCELVWVLNTAYRYSRKQIVLALRQVLVTDCFDVEQHALAWIALYDYDASGADYADCVIAQLNREQGAETTYTFDKKAGKNKGFTLLTTGSL